MKLLQRACEKQPRWKPQCVIIVISQASLSPTYYKRIIFWFVNSILQRVFKKWEHVRAGCKSSTWKKRKNWARSQEATIKGFSSRMKMNLIGEHMLTGRQVPVPQYREVNLIKPSKGFESRISAKSSCQCHFSIKIHPTQGNSLPFPIWAHKSSNLICGDGVSPISNHQHAKLTAEWFPFL